MTSTINPQGVNSRHAILRGFAPFEALAVLIFFGVLAGMMLLLTARTEMGLASEV